MARASARRHAQAVYQLAIEKDQLDQWQRDLDFIVEAFKSPDVRSFLESPKVHFEDKRKILEQQLRGINPLALNLVLLLVVKKRLGIVEELASEYKRLVDEHHGIAHADVTTAVPLDEADRVWLTGKLSSITERKITLATQVIPAIIGGLAIRIGDKLIDGSTRSRLEALRKVLTGARA